jgi:branched-subunit amino acid ABC-type transport system permease component
MSLLIYGTISSIVLALYAVGFSLTYGISGLANFAHGALYILSGFIAWSFLNQVELPYFLSALLSIIISGLIGFGIYWGLLLRVRGIPLAELVVTFAAGVAILELHTCQAPYPNHTSTLLTRRGDTNRMRVRLHVVVPKLSSASRRSDTTCHESEE